VQSSPFNHERQSTRRETSAQNRARFDCYESSLPGIPDVEMRRIMIGLVHLHDNTEETADLRHAGLFSTVTDLRGAPYAAGTGSFSKSRVPELFKKVR
jgi:hypothetical protein